MNTVERFFDQLPLATNIGKLAGLAAVRLSGMKSVGVLGSKFNAGCHANQVGIYVGAAAGAITLAVVYAVKNDAG